MTSGQGVSPVVPQGSLVLFRVIKRCFRGVSRGAWGESRGLGLLEVARVGRRGSVFPLMTSVCNFFLRVVQEVLWRDMDP
jgi:hypothetical protein